VKLNSRQMIALLIGVVIIAAMGIYVPWRRVLNTATFHRVEPAGYALIFDPPQRLYGDAFAQGVEVDVPRVLIPMLVVLVATVAAVLLTGPKAEAPPKEK
jgi:hypothetical protein